MSSIDNAKRIHDYFASLNQKVRDRVAPIVAETAVEYYKESILTGQFDGVPFKPLSPAYQKTKRRNRDKILYRDGLLLASIRSAEVVPDRVRINAGSNKVPYARPHNEGAHIVARANVKPFTRNQFGKSVKVKAHIRNVNFYMPQRRFMGHSAELNRRIITRIKSII